MTDQTPLAAIPSVEPAMQRIFTATLIQGVSGAGKTSLADPFSVYLWETYRKILLLYSWDGGAIPTCVQKRVKQGLIRFWRARTRSAEGLGIDTLYKASKGYFPKVIDPVTGETSPAVALVPPVTTVYRAFCPEQHLLLTVATPALIKPILCTTCKTLVTQAQMQIKESVQRTRGFELVGGAWFDSLTAMSDVVLEHMDHERGAGRIGGEKPAFGGVVQSGDTKLGGNNRADIGFGQSRAHEFINNALTIPYLVEGPIFTALSMETDERGQGDMGEKLTIVGAKLPGRAATEAASSWVGNAYEMGKTLDDRGRSHFTLFLRPFIDDQGRRHLLKTSASPDGAPHSLPDKLIDPAIGEGKPFSVANLGNVFRALDADLRYALEEQDVVGAPGTTSGLAEYGEAITIAPAEAAEQKLIANLDRPVVAPLLGYANVPAAQSVVASVTPTPMARPRASRKPMTATLPVEGAPVPQEPVVSTPGGGVPPPPGMRPPQRAPGS